LDQLAPNDVAHALVRAASALMPTPAIAALLLCSSVCFAAGIPLAFQQTRYEMRVGESVRIAATPETLDFLLKAANLRVDPDGAGPSLVAGPNRTRDQVLLAAPLRISPGEYTATISATSPTGEKRAAPLTIVVKPRQTVPTGSTRPPVVLLNGWETGFTGACGVSSSSADTFGNLAEYLVSDGVPVVYFFDNCVIDPNQTIEVLGNDLATYLNTIQYDNGQQVPQIDLVAFSMGGLIARSYLAGLQPSEIATPPATTLVRDLILIATPNFGSFVAGNYVAYLAATGTQSAELIPGSSFLWNLATWNQRGDDLRGVNALAIVGNAGQYLGSLSATTALNNASDGLVSETSAALGFALLSSTPTQVVPYCHVDPSVFTNTATLGTFDCDAAGIANVTSDTQETGVIVRSFLAGNTDWESVGGTAAKDPWLSIDGGLFFGMENQTANYVTDLTAVAWGSSVALTEGGDTDVIYYTDFVSGSGNFVASSTSLGTVDCGGPLTAPVGYFTAARCKIDTAIYEVGPLSGAPGRIVNSGSTITITGNDFGAQCGSCQVLAIPVNSTTQTALQVSSWTDTSISAVLPASLTGLLTIQVTATPGTDAITIIAAAPTAALAAAPSSLTFAYTAGGAVPAAQTLSVTNGGSGTLTWTATSNQSWLSASPASGTAPSTIAVSVAPASLTAGSYSGTVTITASGASGSPLSVAVTLTVTAAAASLTAAPQSLAFTYSAGGAIPAPQTVSVGSGGSGALTWTATSSQSWLSVSPASGTEPAALTVSVSPAALGAGSYTGAIQITAPGASNSPLAVAVTLTVAASTATLAVTPQALSFAYTYTAGGAAPAPQNISIAIGGSGTLAWSVVSSAFWASVSPASGSASATLSVSVNPANLAAGTYTGNLQIVTTVSTASVAMTLVVKGTQPAGTITGVANGGSFALGFASATWVSIFGTGLSASTASWGAGNFANGMLPASLNGVTVAINGIPAYVEYISPAQINVLAPDDPTTGAVQVQVTTAGQSSNSFTAQKQQFAPAFFTFDNGKYVAAQHANYSLLGAPSAISGATPAQPGETILLYGTGFGPSTPALPTADLVTTAEPLANAVTISIGSVAANVEFAGLVESGLYQFNVTVPSSLPSGDAVVVATIGGVESQTGLSITVQ
jgi:uncharacterized protein (TIGR03437 family)